MADIRDPDLFMRGRWKWTSHGYEAAFPRGIQFTDLDATLEIGRQFLFIETKFWDGIGRPGILPTGQRLYLTRLAALPGATVLVLYGDPETNHPRMVRQPLWIERVLRWEEWDWTGLTVEEARYHLLELFAHFAWMADAAAAS